MAKAGTYRGSDLIGVLAEQIEGLVSQEHGTWTLTREQVDRPGGRAVA